MILRSTFLAAALMAASSPAFAQSRGFDLPPGATPTPDSQVQGPVDTDGPVPVRPRIITGDLPQAVPSPQPTFVLPSPSPTASSTAPRQPVRPVPSAEPSPSGASESTQQTPVAGPERQDGAETFESGSPPQNAQSPAIADPAPQPSPPPQAAAETDDAGLSAWWIGGAMLVGLALALVALRRRRPGNAPAQATVPPSSAPKPVGPALALEVVATRLDRSVMNATLGYRITVRNRSAHALSGVVIEADLVSASGERPMQEQLASRSLPLTPCHRAERIPPGGSQRFEGQVRLALSQVTVIRQGNIGLLVPLLRVRAMADGVEPIVATLVVGQGAGARPQPFRLDEPPRSYAPLAQRVLDSVPVAA